MKVFSKNAQIPESLYLITSSTKMKTYFQVDTLKVPTQISSELALLNVVSSRLGTNAHQAIEVDSYMYNLNDPLNVSCIV